MLKCYVIMVYPLLNTMNNFEFKKKNFFFQIRKFYYIMANSKVSSTATARLKQDYMRLQRDPVSNF